MVARRGAEWLPLAEKVLAHAKAEGASDAEVLVSGDDAQLTRFANSEIHQNVAETNAQVNLRFVSGKRIGVASSGRLDDDGLRRLAEQAAAIARNVEELPDWAGLPEPTPIEAEDYLGVDLGIVNVAVDSDGVVYSGEAVERSRRIFAHCSSLSSGFFIGDSFRLAVNHNSCQGANL